MSRLWHRLRRGGFSLHEASPRPPSGSWPWRVACTHSGRLACGGRELGFRDGAQPWELRRISLALAMLSRGTDDCGWLVLGAAGMRWRQLLRQGAGQRVKQEMAGAEV